MYTHKIYGYFKLISSVQRCFNNPAFLLPPTCLIFYIIFFTSIHFVSPLTAYCEYR